MIDLTSTGYYSSLLEKILLKSYDNTILRFSLPLEWAQASLLKSNSKAEGWTHALL